MLYVSFSKDILYNGIYYRLVRKKNRKSFSIFFSAENIEKFNKIGAEKYANWEYKTDFIVDNDLIL